MIDWAAVDEALADKQAVVVVGAGGVGKTTVAASLGVRAAQLHGRRVLVATVDPARRLADALGVYGLPGEPVIVPVGDGDGRLWVLMVEMSGAWDDLVRRSAPSSTVAEAILHNSLYRSLTTRFVASHDYVALDHLNLLNDGPYDLIIVDTPPGEHAADVFAAPGRLQQFFESRLLRWLTVGVGSGITRIASRPFLAVAERLLGGDFLTQIREFFTLFAKLRPAVVDRIENVEAVLASDDAVLIEVAAADGGGYGLNEAEPATSGAMSRLLLVNKVLPTSRVSIEDEDDDGSGRQLVLSPGIAGQDLDALRDPSLRRAVDQLVDNAGPRTVVIGDAEAVALLPRQVGGVHELDDLVALTAESADKSWIVDER